MQISGVKIDVIQGMQEKNLEPYRVYGERIFLRRNEVVRDFYRTSLL